MELAEKTSFKRGATDFSSQVAKMKAANCDLVVLGTIIRETIGTVGEARKTGFNPTFIGSSAAYTDLIHKLGGKAMDGVYATMTVQNPYTDEQSQPLRFWANKYKTKFNEDPTVFSVYGYVIIDSFIKAAHQGRPEPHDRQLHQGDGQHHLRARHVRQPEEHLHGHQAPGQRPVAAVADQGRQVEGRL
jgi:branched-chain amino acid transport system substrate-binding protein